MNWLAAIAALGVIVFAQVWLGRFVRSRGAAAFIRIVLGLLGLAVGIVMARLTRPESVDLDLALVIVGCGLVHAPAAGVLLIKQWRGESPS